MEYKRKRLIRATLQKAESKHRQTVRQAESATDAEQQTPEEYAQTVVSEKAIHTEENLQSKALDTGRISYRQFRILQEKRQRVPTHMLPSPLKQKMPPWGNPLTREKPSRANAFGRRRWISEKSELPISTVTKCRR